MGLAHRTVNFASAYAATTISTGTSVLVSLDHAPTTNVTTDLQLVWSDANALSVGAVTVIEPAYTVTASSRPVMLPLPSSVHDDTVTVRIVWTPGAPLQQSIGLNQTISAQPRPGVDAVLRIGRCFGAVLGVGQVATQLTDRSADPAAVVPTMSVIGVASALRGDSALNMTVALQLAGVDAPADRNVKVRCPM